MVDNVYGYQGQFINGNVYGHLRPEEQRSAITGDALQAALRGETKTVVNINGKRYDLSQNGDKCKLACEIAVKTGRDVGDVLADIESGNIDAVGLRQQLDLADSNSVRAGRADNVLILDMDRYAKVEAFSPQPKVPENMFLKELESTFPKSKYPKLYKKDGTLNEGKAWKELGNELLYEGFYGKSRQTRIAELKQQGMSQDDAEKVIDAQNAQILKVEENANRKISQNSGYELTEDEQKILNARTGADDIVKNMKTFKKNVDKSTKRINNAIEKMNNWDWNKNLNGKQQEIIRNAVKTYSRDQAKAINPNATEEEQLKIYYDIFDEKGNVPAEKKNAFYQFIMDYVVGTDGQVNKSAKKGNFFEKLFTKSNMEGTEKRASRDLGLDKKDIEAMGFDWEGQINWGQALLDGIPAGALGAIFGTAVSSSSTNSNSATAHANASVDAQDISGETPYSGAVDYMVNGEVVMQIPYDGVAKCLHHIPGVFASDTQTANATATAKVSAVLPSTLIAAGTAVLNSAINQGINGNEADIFNNNLYDILSTKGNEALTQDPDDPTGKTPIDIPSGIAKRAGLTPGTPEFRLATEIAKYYVDDKGIFHKTEFLTDWQYNGGYDSKYLNKEEAAVWLNDLRQRGPLKSNTPRNEVGISVYETIPPQFRVNQFTAVDQGGMARSGAISGHNVNTTFDFAEGIRGEVITEMNDPNSPVTAQPDIIRGFDHSNQYGDMHEYKYIKLSPAEITEAKNKGQLPQDLSNDAVIYRLESVVDHSHSDISIKSNNVELYLLEENEQSSEDNVGYNNFKLTQPKGFAGYNQSAILSTGTINEKITKLNGGKPRL